MQIELVGRGKIRTLSKVGEIIGALHGMEGRGYTELDQGTVRTGAKTRHRNNTESHNLKWGHFWGHLQKTQSE